MVAGLFQRLVHDVASYPSDPELRVGRGHQRLLARLMASLIARWSLSPTLWLARNTPPSGRLHLISIAAAP
jgi:hypothetical protein